ncbi:hypothetical protein [Micromonospora aurantiaca]|uniref:hypothetical protein n=1 Tax=Micromonospora aurantiaca (nom. illeg.) TaxID=47850 RepID=UPI002E197383
MARTDLTATFSYPTAGEWPQHLVEAIVNTCREEGLTPAPRDAILEALAPMLVAGEAKRIIERRRDGRYLKATAYHLEGSKTGNPVLLLAARVHGAATLPWPLNDRTRNDWLHPSASNLARLDEVIAAGKAVTTATEKVRRLKTAQRTLGGSAPRAEKDAAVAALAAAEFELEDANAQLKVCEAALGQRRPLPAVHAATEDGKPVAALATAVTSPAAAAEIQRYAVDRLEKRGGQRPYDLVESLIQEGQRESTIVVLQLTELTGADSDYHTWRGFQVTGNNRAYARLFGVFGINPADLLIGVPQRLIPLPGEGENTHTRIISLAEILRRVSASLNAEYDDPDRDPEGRAARAARLADVPARVVVGVQDPAHLEAALRDLNVHEHLRGQLAYDDEDRALGLWSTVVKAYQTAGRLAAALAADITKGRVSAAELDEAGIADALVGAGPLDPLAVLLTPGEPATAMALRDMAIRCTTTLMFPPVNEPDERRSYQRVDTGQDWPIVRRTLQEASWSQQNGPKAVRRTEVWAAVVAQHFVHRGNLLAMRGAFGARDVQYGVSADARSLTNLINACRDGVKGAWETLVQRHLLPGLVNAPEPFITAGQGSEVGPKRKGVRRTPASAVDALVHAYNEPNARVSRELLIAFAIKVLEAPDATTGVKGMPGTFWAPGLDGQPRTGVLADKSWFDATFPPPTSAKPKLTGGDTGDGSGGQDDNGGDAGAEGGSQPLPDTITTEDEIVEDAPTRMVRLRGEVPKKMKTISAAAGQLKVDFEELVEMITEAAAARVEAGAIEVPVDVQKAHTDELKEIKAKINDAVGMLAEAIVAVTDL